MKYLFLLIFLIFSIYELNAQEVTVIELYKNSVDQGILNNLDQDEELNIDSESNETKNIDIDDNNLQIESNNEIIINENDIVVLPDFWEKIDKDELIFLLKNISSINSPSLRKEFLSMLDINNSPPENMNKYEFENLIINSLIRYGNRNKAYQIMKNIEESDNQEYAIFYKKFELNYLLSTYNLSEACEFRNKLKNQKLNIANNFLLKLNFFCLFLQEKLDEANLLYSLLEESEIINDEYFKYIFKFLKNTDNLTYETSINNNLIINENLIYLYSAMHRVGNIPLNEKFLKIDPINLSMPIILSKSTNISLRLQAAHAAYNNELLGIDSLAALYQTVDFSFDELNDSSILASELEKKVELGMAYYYQLANIQILPITRLEALINFWKFAEKHNLKKIAYNLSNKILDSIEPSNELAEFGATIAKTYIYNRNFEKAEKWLLFSESFFNNGNNDIKLVSSKLLYNLFYVNKSEEFIEALMSGLQNFNNQNDDNNFVDNEILFTIFSILNDIDPNPFILNKNIYDSRFIPSIYIMNKIRTAIKTENQSEILLSIIASIEGKKWSQLHPEHLRLVLIGLREYKNELILNEIILEILEKNKII